MYSISVVVPIYYGEKYIPDIIYQIEVCRAYLDMRYSIEILFVNDSPNAPISKIWESNLVKIQVINSDYNAGIHGARIKGLMQCQGEYVLFLDQDDKISPEYFFSQLQAIGQNDASICRALNGGVEFYTEDILFENIINKNFALRSWNLILSPGQVLIRRRSIPQIWIDKVMQYNGADDWLLWLCMMANNCSFALNDDILYNHIWQDKNASNDVINMLRSEQELMQIIQENKVFSDKDFGFLMEGFFEKNLRRTQEIYCRMCNEKSKVDILNKWIRLREKNINFSDYLQLMGIKSVAIYGHGILGEHLYDELKGSIEIEYFIDKNAKGILEEIPVYTLQELLPQVDGVVITLVSGIEKVKKEIKKTGIRKVFILKDWIMENGLKSL